MIFVDTSALRAKFDRDDKHREAALPTWRSLERDGQALFTTNYVVEEIVTYLSRASSAAAAADVGRRLLGSAVVELVRVGPGDEFRALQIMEEIDAELSFTDATSFAIMRRRGIKAAFTFDGDFAAAGFETIP